MDALNTVSCPETISQLGESAFKRITELCGWLYKSGPPAEYRIAPSIITRSECELFGISSPRFAIRKYVHIPSLTAPTGEDPELKAFFNLRRLQWLRNAIDASHPGMFNPGLLQDELVSRGLAVADSLIVPPDRYNRFHILSCDLAREYGLEVKSLQAVPFLQQLQIGGGMCAQACIFMALCLMEKLGATISGVAELTAIANQVRTKLAVKGLDSNEIVNVLSSPECGLSAFHEYVPTDAGKRPGIYQMTLESLRAYCRSNMPVICLVDGYSVAGRYLPIENRSDSIHGMNGLLNQKAQVQRMRVTGRPAHAMLLVGCEDVAGESKNFLLNDPAKYPLLLANYDLLQDARQSDKQSLNFISIFPVRINTPLIGNSTTLGAMGMAEGLQTALDGSRANLLTSFGIQSRRLRWPGKWLLFNASTENLMAQLERLLPSSDLCQYAEMRLSRSIADGILSSNKWYWLQAVQEAGRKSKDAVYLWVWEAEKSLALNATCASMYSMVVAVFRRDSSYFTRIHPN